MNERNQRQILSQLKDDPVYFSKLLLGFTPYWYQEKLMRADSRRIAACWGRQTGKSWSIGAKVTHFAFTRPNTNSLIISRGLRQSILMFSVVAAFIMKSAILRRSVVRITRTEIELKNGSKITALPCSQNGHNLRGHTADLVIMDEASFMPEPVIAGVIFPMLATTEKSRGTGYAIMISTPWGRQHIFYRCFTNPSWFTMHIKSDQCPMITKKFLQEQRVLIGKLRFETEYEAQFKEDATALFTQDMLRGIFEAAYYEKRVEMDQPHLVSDEELAYLSGMFTGSHAMGIDIGKRRDHSVVSIYKKSKRIVARDLSKEIGSNLDEIETETIKPAWMLVYQKEFALGTKLTTVMAHCKWLTTKYKVKYAAIDVTQIGEMPYEVLKADLPILQGVWFSAQEKQNVIMCYYLMVEQRRIGIPFGGDNEEHIAQLAEQQYGYGQAKPNPDNVYDEKGVMKFWHPDGRHDDRFISSALAIYSTIKEAKRSQSGARRIVR